MGLGFLVSRFLNGNLIRLFFAGLAALGIAPSAWSNEACIGSPQGIRFQAPLSRSLGELRLHHRLTIVAMGSSSTYGTGASTPSHSYPAVLQRELSANLPDAKIRVLNRGIPGEDLFEMLPRLDRDVIAEHPDLVILQLGTNFVLRRLPIDTFLPALMVAVSRIQKSGADVVLMDPQYTPRLAGRRDLDSVVRAMNEISEHGHIDLISRYDMMKSWAERGQFSTTNMLSRDGLHMNDASYGCLGDTVATALLGALHASAASHMVSATMAPAHINTAKLPASPLHHVMR